MTDTQLNELKQFFASTLTVTIKREVGGIRDEMNRRFDEADEKYMMMFNEILNTIGHRFNEHEAVITQHSATIMNHENRIIRLEAN